MFLSVNKFNKTQWRESSMGKEIPSEREHQILSLINRHQSEYQQMPTNKWLAEAFLKLTNPDAFEEGKTSTSEWFATELKSARKNTLTILGRLAKNGFIFRNGSRSQLTSKATQYFSQSYSLKDRSRPLNVLPAHIIVRGTVQAGRTQRDLDIDTSLSSSNSIPIPDVNPDRNTYALRVQGKSMEHENILAGCRRSRL